MKELLLDYGHFYVMLCLILLMMGGWGEAMFFVSVRILGLLLTLVMLISLLFSSGKISFVFGG